MKELLLICISKEKARLSGKNHDRNACRRVGNCEITFSFEIGKASILDQYVTFV